MTDTLKALRLASVWIDLLIDHADVDPDDTTIKVKVEPSGREIETFYLADTQKLIAKQIEALSGEEVAR